jgi:hypothetical protein
LVSLAKSPSAAFNQEADVGVKWKLHHGCRASHAFTFGCFVGGAVVDDGVDRFGLWHGRLGDIEKADKLLMPVTLHAATDDHAVQHIKRCEQRGRAMAFIVVRHRAAAAFLMGNPAWPVERFWLYG